MFSFNIDKVNFEEELGEGAHGTIYAYNQKNPKDEQYVVKRISTSKVDTMLMNMQEIVLGFNCDHPHVLPIKGYHIGFDKSSKLWSIYMKMPRMMTSLKERINKHMREGKSFTEEEVAKYLYSLTLGLKYLHSKYIAHRDIKPDNILIDKNNQLKIADIGIGKLIEDDNTETLTQALGTPLYTAPEVLINTSKLKKKGLFVADIWSLGVIMAEICVPKARLINTNASGKDNEFNLTKILEGLEGKYNKVLLSLVSRMLRANPQERISLNEVQTVLEENFPKILGLGQDASKKEAVLKQENEAFKLEIEHLQKQIKQLEEQMAQLCSDKPLHIPQQDIIKNDEEKKIEDIKPQKTQFQGHCLKTLTGHTDIVRCLQVLPMDQLASGSMDKTIKIWNSKTGDSIKLLTGHTEAVGCLQLLQTGELVSSSADETIKLWGMKTGSCIRTLTGHTSTVLCLETLPTGGLVSGSDDKTIKLWNTETGKCYNTLKEHIDCVNCVKLLSADELASGSQDRMIKIWDLKTGQCIKTLKGHFEAVTCLEVLPTGELVSSSYDRMIRFWDPKTENCLRTLKGHTGMVWCIQLLPTGDLASGSEDRTVKIWDTKLGKCIKTLEGNTQRVFCLRSLPTGELVGSFDKAIKIWK